MLVAEPALEKGSSFSFPVRPVALYGPIPRTAGFSLPQTEAPLLIRPYLTDMTMSEIHAVMTGGFSTIAGSVMGAYISFGVSARAADPHAPCYRVLTCKNCPGPGDEGRPPAGASWSPSISRMRAECPDSPCPKDTSSSPTFAGLARTLEPCQVESSAMGPLPCVPAQGPE